MRLTCPNCSARYEVADSMVPPEGRDVQCSNCATTWFQPGRRTDQQTKASMAPPPATVDPAATPSPSPEVSHPASEPAPQPASEIAPTRRTLDPDLRSILQEEAEREARLRRAEADPVETQGEMPLDQDRGEASRPRRHADLDAVPDAFAMNDHTPADVARGDGPSARDLFPDIDEINSTLRDTGDRSGREEDASDIDTLDTVPRRRRGARIGFFGVIAIAALAATVYAKSDDVVAAMPAAAPAVMAFVETVDAGRIWLDAVVRGLAGATTEG